MFVGGVIMLSVDEMVDVVCVVVVNLGELIDFVLLLWIFDWFVCGDFVCSGGVLGGMVGFGFVIVCLVMELYGGIV